MERIEEIVKKCISTNAELSEKKENGKYYCPLLNEKGEFRCKYQDKNEHQGIGRNIYYKCKRKQK